MSSQPHLHISCLCEDIFIIFLSFSFSPLVNKCKYITCQFVHMCQVINIPFYYLKERVKKKVHYYVENVGTTFVSDYKTFCHCPYSYRC
jgi:hypothetical protein